MENIKHYEMAYLKDMRRYGKLSAFSLKLNSEVMRNELKALILLHFTKEQTKIYTKITPNFKSIAKLKMAYLRQKVGG